MTQPGKLRSGVQHYSFELIVIVSGITLSFFLNEWRQERRGNEAMRMDLLAIQRNLESDHAEVIDLLERHTKGVKALEIGLVVMDETSWSTWIPSRLA